MAGQRVIGWKVTVGDSRSSTHVVTSREMRWADVPSRVVVIILYLDDGRRRIIGNRDYYWHVGDGSRVEDWDSGWATPRVSLFKLGWLLEDDEYLRSQAAAIEDRVRP